MKDELKTLARIVSYPVLGNLSRNVQEGIEKLTKGEYDATTASEVSAATNVVLVYPALFAYNFYQAEPSISCAVGSSILGFIYGLAEFIGRGNIATKKLELHSGMSDNEIHFREMRHAKEQEKREGLYDIPVASLAGKMVSLPIDIPAWVYSKVKKHSQKD
ncbi:hypothetical protein JXB27_01065 [Candidatus Woesearchaeota archaeon]|nr:hypothetical protein [Candidatus Woesearchaeota archaeon]